MTITPPLWGVLVGFALVFAWLFPKAMKEDQRNALIADVEQEIAERNAMRHRRVPTQEIESDDIPA